MAREAGGREPSQAEVLARTVEVAQTVEVKDTKTTVSVEKEIIKLTQFNSTNWRSVSKCIHGRVV